MIEYQVTHGYLGEGAMKEIFDAIEVYAAAYLKLEELQLAYQMELPRGDQKTGVIAEFFARTYARSRFRNAKLNFGKTSQHAWDIHVVLKPILDLRIQVKAVSAHSSTRRISPIHPGWGELWLMSLDHRFLPEAFWIIVASEANWSKQTIRHRSMPKAHDPQSGSRVLRGGRDEFAALRSALISAGLRFPSQTTPQAPEIAGG
jgi:hypothetical protein